MQDQGKCKVFVIDWYRKVADLIEYNNTPEMQKYLRERKLNVGPYNSVCMSN